MFFCEIIIQFSNFLAVSARNLKFLNDIGGIIMTEVTN